MMYNIAGVSDVESSSLLPTWLTLRGRFPWFLTYVSKHERWRSSSNPSLNGQLHYPPPDLDRPLNEAVADRILVYRAD